MFAVKNSYQSPQGEIKFSSAPPVSVFKNKTKGLALKYVYEGEEEYLTTHQPLKVGKGLFILLRQDQPYQARSHPNSSQTAGICIDLSESFVGPKIPSAYDLDLLFELPVQGSHFLNLSKTFAQLPLASNLSSPAFNWGPMLNQIGDDLKGLVDTLEHLQPLIATQAKKINTQRQLLAKLILAKNYIHQHYTSNLTLYDLSRCAGISAYHFSRLFQICFQQSPFDLQLELRMKTAVRRMNQNQSSLSQIAFELGYHDLPAFSNQFKRYYQQSPSEMRKNL